jgi:ABC-type branched-subunit amino acid transport system substrate-binding protein
MASVTANLTFHQMLCGHRARFPDELSKGIRLMKTRIIALCCALALLASACGSRLSDGELEAGAGTGGGGGTAGADTGSKGDASKGPGIESGDDGPKVGSLPVPCGEGSGTPKAPPAGTEGVTADTIKIAVISDKSGQVKVPTASIEESMKAFVKFCNDFGGINGRKLELKPIDSKLFSHLEATKEACAAGVFAIVGSGSVTDNQGAQAMVDCGLIEVPAYAVTAAKSLSDNVVMPLPNPTNEFNIGPAKWIKDKYPDAIKKSAILHGDIEAVNVQAARVIEAYKSQGFKFTYDKKTAVIQENYASEVRAMKDKGIKYVTMVSATQEVVKLLHDMKTQGFEPEVVDLGQQYYDPELLAEPGAEGALVQLNTVPFEEEEDSKALQAYRAAYEQVGTDVKATSLGVQSFSAGLLFATAVKAAGDDLTRENVLAELRKIDDWDGGGLHFPGHAGTNAVSTCFMYSEVKGGKFVRLHPKKATTFDCKSGKAYVKELSGDYGAGAKAGK